MEGTGYMLYLRITFNILTEYKHLIYSRVNKGKTVVLRVCDSNLR